MLRVRLLLADGYEPVLVQVYISHFETFLLEELGMLFFPRRLNGRSYGLREYEKVRRQNE
jgi:hypothetical protein